MKCNKFCKFSYIFIVLCICRYPAGFLNTSQPPPRLQGQIRGQGQPPSEMNPPSVGQGQMPPPPPPPPHLQNTPPVGTNPFRFPPPALGNPSQPPPGMPFAGFPLPLGMQQGRNVEKSNDSKPPSRENSLDVGFPGLFQSFDKDFPKPSQQPPGSGSSMFDMFGNQPNNPQNMPGMGKFGSPPFPGNLGQGPRPNLQDMRNFPGGFNAELSQLSQNLQAQQQKMQSQQPPSNMASQQQTGLSLQQNLALNILQQLKEQQQTGGDNSANQQAFPGHMMGQLTGRHNLANQSFPNHPMKPENFGNSDRMGSFTQIAVQVCT